LEEREPFNFRTTGSPFSVSKLILGYFNPLAFAVLKRVKIGVRFVFTLPPVRSGYRTRRDYAIVL
jgi:hypothetical protein